MTKKLFVQAITKYLLGVVLVGALIFLSAGTFLLSLFGIVLPKITYRK